MYKKKDKKVTVIAAVVVVAFIAAIYILPGVLGSFGEKKEVQETEPAEYEVLIHKTDAGRIDIRKSWLKSDGEDETKLSVKPGTLVSLNLTPKANKVLTAVHVVDAKDFNNEIATIVSETKDNTYTIDFSMPEANVVMTFQFETLETEKQEPETTPVPPQTETETEKETEAAGNPYGLTVHGITADIIVSYNGLFDDRDFCQQLGDALHLDSPRSEYYGVTDVTFSQETYKGERDSDKVYYYIYFGEDPERKMLSTYYLKDKSYVFTKYAPPEPETEDKDDNEGDGSSGDGTVNSTGSVVSQGNAGTTGGSYSTGTQGRTTTTSFDILQVSKVFLDYTGDQERFYSKAFEYVLSKGLTGSITGTMKEYSIDAEKKRAEITITLNTGGSFKATYNKAKNEFSFSGL